MGHLSPELIKAAHDADVNRIAELHAAGESLLGTDEDGADLLFHLLWQSCDPELLGRLIALGGRPANLPSKDGTPLIAAIWCKKPQLVRLLLDAGADPNVIGFLGDDEASALDTVIDDYCDCDSQEELERMVEIERLIRSAGGRVHRNHPQGGRFPNWIYEVEPPRHSC